MKTPIMILTASLVLIGILMVAAHCVNAYKIYHRRDAFKQGIELCKDIIRTDEVTEEIIQQQMDKWNMAIYGKTFKPVIKNPK